MTKQHRGTFFTSPDFLIHLWKFMLISPYPFTKPDILSSKILSKYPCDLVYSWSERKDLFLPPHLMLNQSSYFQISSPSIQPVVTSFLSFRYWDRVQLNFQQMRFSQCSEILPPSSASQAGLREAGLKRPLLNWQQHSGLPSVGCRAWKMALSVREKLLCVRSFWIHALAMALG